ncbi:hypothetical protein B0H12DRAFT_1120829 [Mycena haematopus]|nr:hypothetical protein B0H12DRAFT_1120829 [Mycena haematopus]
MSLACLLRLHSVRSCPTSAVLALHPTGTWHKQAAICGRLIGVPKLAFNSSNCSPKKPPELEGNTHTAVVGQTFISVKRPHFNLRCTGQSPDSVPRSRYYQLMSIASDYCLFRAAPTIWTAIVVLIVAK